MKVRSEKHGVEAEVYFYQEGDELPTTGTYFAVTSEGYFLHLDGGGVVSGLVPCRKEDLTPFLGKLEEKAFYNFPPIPFEQFVQALTFLRATYRKHKSEACVILLYRFPTLNFQLKKASEEMKELVKSLPANRDEWDKDQRLQVIEQHSLIQTLQAEYQEGQEGDMAGIKNIDHSQCGYVVACPKQKVSSASVNYGEEHTGERISDIVKEIRENDPVVEECGDDYSHQYMHVCSIHSHPDFNAYHSGVDDRDEFDWDGLHLTIGGVMKDDFEISASLTLQGTRFMLDPLDCVDGVNKTAKIVETGFFSWAAPKTKADLFHLAYDPEDVLNVQGIRENSAKWVKDKVSGGFLFGGQSRNYGSSWSQNQNRNQPPFGTNKTFQNRNNLGGTGYYGDSQQDGGDDDDSESG
jgi:proteasome lid subunit RPN8/RPN11